LLILADEFEAAKENGSASHRILILESQMFGEVKVEMMCQSNADRF
jgi:hypothetical protein